MDELELYKEVKRLVAEALELDPRERSALLDGAAPEVRARAEALLQREGDEALPDAPNLLLGREVAGYRLLRLAGSGGSSLVFEAEQDEPRRRVAIKLLLAGETGGAPDETRWRRFRAEGDALARLDHPHIARVVEAGAIGDTLGATHFLAVEWIEGARDLVGYAREHGLDRDARLELFEGVVDAVAHAHRRGIVHRDLKPSNVLVDEEGRPRVIDFGIARWMDRVGATQHGEFLGTLAYASPEQCAGDPDAIGPPTDVHALGLLLFELLHDVPAFDLEGRSLSQAMSLIRDLPPRRKIPGAAPLPRDLDALLEVALAKEPTRRYVDADALLADLRRFRADLPVEARPPGLAADTRLFLRRHRAAAVAGLVILLAGVVTLASVAVQESRARSLEREAKERAQEATDFVVSLLALADPRLSEPRDLTVEALLDEATRRLEERPISDPGAAAELHATLGNSYRELGRPEAATWHFERALEEVRAMETAPTLYHVGVLNSFGHALIEAGETERAIEVLRESVAVQDADPASAPVLRAITSSQLARAHALRGELEAAEREAQFALEVYREALGPRHRAVPRALNTLVEVHLSRDELGPALELAETALELDLENHGADALVTARSRLSLARVAAAGGDEQRALDEARSAASTYERLLDAGHPKRLAAEELVRELSGDGAE